MGINMRSFFFVAILFLTSATHAAMVDNGSFTTDTSANLDWLDLTATRGMSYNQVSAELGEGGDFEGWRYATLSEVVTFLENNGGNPSDSNIFDYENVDAAEAVINLWGGLDCTSSYCRSTFLYDESLPLPNGGSRVGRVWDYNYERTHQLTTFSGVALAGTTFSHMGSALVSTSAVPIPAAVWLFGSALAGLGWFRRRQTA
jgi:hypothetical protein